MTPILRAYKYEVPVLIRICGKHGQIQRRQWNHYDVLGITSNATQKEIREAYIRLSKEAHPDSGKNGTHDKFVKINQAYSILSKLDERQQYDNSLKRSNVRYNTEFYYNNAHYDDIRHSRHYRDFRARQNGTQMKQCQDSMTMFIMLAILVSSFIIIPFQLLSRKVRLTKDCQRRREDPRMAHHKGRDYNCEPEFFFGPRR